MRVSISKSPVSIDDITAIVATHERQQPLNEMIKSFREYYPQLKIIAVDSSSKTNKREDIQHILTDSNA
jgi:GT2 family glycosyltransferase